MRPLKIWHDRVSRQVRMLSTAFYDYFPNRSTLVGLISLVNSRKLPREYSSLWATNTSPQGNTNVSTLVVWWQVFVILLFKTNQNGTFESWLFRQACAVRNEDSRYEFTGKNFAVQPLCRACAFLLKQRIEVVCSLSHQWRGRLIRW